jgi:hypothetical protein
MSASDSEPPVSDSEPREEFGPVERELVRLLRCLDLSELQSGRRERCWEEFRALANLPERLPAESSQPSQAPALEGETIPVPEARQTSTPPRRLRPLPRASGAG